MNYYSTPAFSVVPETFEELVTDNRWGVSPPEIDLDYLRDPYDLPADGTGEWIFKDDKYKKWQESKESEVLWLCGGPGTGKTMLGKRVAAEILRGPSDPPGGVKLVYYFLSPEPRTDRAAADEAESPGRRLAIIGWGLLYAILEQDEGLFSCCKAELEIQGNKFFTNPNSLWRVLRRAIQDCPTDSVYILIDGVDGLNEGLREGSIRRILGLMDIRKVKIFLSSRDVPHISNNLSARSNINLDTNSFVKGDVETFVKRRVNAFQGWSCDQKEGAIKTLLDKSEGTFLWASLSIENLNNYCTGHNYEVFLREPPLRLKDEYRKILYDVQSREGSEKVLEMIRIVALALRPLTFGELGHILAYIEDAWCGQQRSCGEASAEISPRAEKDIRMYVKRSQGFLRVSATTVSIVHHTAIECLFDETLHSGQQVSHKSDLDLALSWECFRYLHYAFGDPEKFPKGNDTGCLARSRESSSKPGHPEGPAEAPWEVAQKDPQEALAKWPYLRYAAESWLIHARRSIEITEHKFCDGSARNWLQYQFFDASDVIRKPWIELCGDPKMEILTGDQTPLDIAVCLGLVPLVEEALLDSNAGTESINTSLPPLHLAAKFMSGAYKILIAKGSPSLLIAPDQYGNTPLHKAAISGSRDMVVALMKKLAECREHRDGINKQNYTGNTPLHLAFQFDHPDIVEFLVKSHADLTIRNNQGVTASELGAMLGRGDSLDILNWGAEEIREESVEGFVEETVEGAWRRLWMRPRTRR